MFRNSIALRRSIKSMTCNIVHGTAIAIGENGVLLLGPSGSGKSDLALRLIDRGAKLISDDAVVLDTAHGSLLLAPAPNIEGMIELRGIGICTADYALSAPLCLVVELTDNVERMPEAHRTTIVSGYDIPHIGLAPFEVSTAIKVEYALRAIVDAGQFPVARTSSDTAEGILT